MADPPVAPILLIAFNRPDLTRIVLGRIREQRPAQLWVAVDGPRDDVGTDDPLVEAVRAICDEEIDWRCEVKRRYHATNQGCLMAVSGAVSWFLDDAGSGIIIEDDCLPHPSFFPYATTLLRKYEHDPAVMHIGGTNALAPVRRPWSYYFSRYNRIWGWATWRRAWRHIDATLSLWPDVKAAGAHRPHLPFEDERIMWEARWDSIYEGRRDSWADSWFLCRLLHGRAVVPTVNLVSNLGFREDALHTTDASSYLAARACQPMAFPLTHPSSREPDEELDRLFYEAYVRPWVPARSHATDPPS